MQRNSSSMSVPRPVSGSKPRKHITKISYDNPSLISNSVTALFKHPVALQLPAKIRQQPPSIISDSLTRAQHQFLLRKDKQNPQNSTNSPYIAQKQLPSPSGRMPLQRRYSTPAITPNIITNSKYNFTNHQIIKNKQNHGYNIINCYPTGQKDQ